MISQFIHKLKISFTQNPKRTLFWFLSVFLFFGLLFESGTVWEADSSSRVKEIVAVFVFCMSLFAYLLYFDYGRFLDIFKKHHFFLPSGEFFIYVFLTILCLGSFLYNSEKNVNVNTYISFFLTLSSAYFLIRTFSFSTFASLYVKTMIVICVLSLFFYAFFAISGFDFSSSVIKRTSSVFLNNFFSVFYWINRDGSSVIRLQGPFWEPGVFATFLCLGLLLYFCFWKKRNPLIPLLFLLCVVLTFSTAGYIIVLFVFSFVFCKKNKGLPSRLFPIFFFEALLAVFVFWEPLSSFLGHYAPALFGKVATENSSFTTRAYSWLYGLKVFAENPFFGFGGQTARDLYFALIAKDSISIDAFTSTLGYLAASFGILGLLCYFLPFFGIFFIRNYSISEKLFLLILYVLLTNQENQSTLYFAQIIYFYLALNIKRIFPAFKKQKCFEEEKASKTLLDTFFQKDNSGIVASNVAGIGVVKCISLALGIITIPIYLAFFNNDNSAYGAWLTIVSVLNWILTFDFGFGNSLRNKLSEAVVNRDKRAAKAYISSAYCVTGIVSLVWIVVLMFVVQFVDLNVVLGISTTIISPSALKTTVLLLFIGIALELTLKNIIYVLDVMGKSVISASLPLTSNLLLLFFALSINLDGDSRYVVLGAIYCLAVLLPYIIPTVSVFLIRKKMPSPSVRALSKESNKAIFSMGIGFFIVQSSNLFLWSLNELLINKIMGDPSFVLVYTEYYKIFGAIWGLSMIVQSPIWVSLSKAYSEKSISIVKKDIKFSLLFFLGIFFLCIIAGVSLSLIFSLWLGESSPGVYFPFVLVFEIESAVYCACGFVILICNGLGIIKPQAIVAAVAMLLKVPLCILLSFLLKDYLQWSIVVLANVFLYLPYIPVCLHFIRKKIRTLEELNQ